jgi:hypothetical protein
MKCGGYASAVQVKIKFNFNTWRLVHRLSSCTGSANEIVNMSDRHVITAFGGRLCLHASHQTGYASRFKRMKCVDRIM